MRHLMMIIMAVFLAAPVFAASETCNITGPHNCQEQNEDYLVSLTKNTIHSMELTGDQHPFKTKNDEVLEAYSRQHAQLAPAQGQYSGNQSIIR